MRIGCNTSKKDMAHRKSSGLSFHIHCTGLTKSKGRAEAIREHGWWKDMLKHMNTYLRGEGYAEDALQLKRDVSIYEYQNKLFVEVHPDSWHIFTYALRKLDNNAYLRIMAAAKRGSNETGWW